MENYNQKVTCNMSNAHFCAKSVGESSDENLTSSIDTLFPLMLYSVMVTS